MRVCAAEARADRAFRPPPVGIQSVAKGVPDVAAVCDVCGKGPGFGKSVSHSHRRTSRRWNPNIQTVHAKIGQSQRKRLNVCTSCLKAGKVTRG
jgi:large subunit ribosomal protein L28